MYWSDIKIFSVSFLFSLLLACFNAAVAAADIIIVDESEDRTSSTGATTDINVAVDAYNDSSGTDLISEARTSTASVGGAADVPEQMPVDRTTETNERPLSAVTLDLMAHSVVYTNGKPSGSKWAIGMLISLY